MSEFTVIPRKNLNKDVLLEKFPRSSGKIPALESPAVRLTETIAIAVVSQLYTGPLPPSHVRRRPDLPNARHLVPG